MTDDELGSDPVVPARGAEQAGISRHVASHVGERIVAAFAQQGRRVRLKGLRFIPSTKVELGQGAFQVMANTIIEPAEPVRGFRRAEAVDSVVTVKGLGKQELAAVTVPSLGRNGV